MRLFFPVVAIFAFIFTCGCNFLRLFLGVWKLTSRMQDEYADYFFGSKWNGIQRESLWCCCSCCCQPLPATTWFLITHQGFSWMAIQSKRGERNKSKKRYMEISTRQLHTQTWLHVYSFSPCVCWLYRIHFFKNDRNSYLK